MNYFSSKALSIVGIAMCFLCVLAQQPEKNPAPNPPNLSSPILDAGKPPNCSPAAGSTISPGGGSTIWDAKTIVAGCALFVALASLISSIFFSLKAREHNRRSVQPMPYILQPDLENRTAVIIQNNGTGPLVLEKAEAKIDNRAGHLIDLIPAPPERLRFTNFNRIEQVRPIRPGDLVDLLDLSIKLDDAEAVRYRKELRRALGDMIVELTYSDVYGTRFPVYRLKLDWFHRQ